MNSDFAWKIFELTGSIDAYMIYIEQCRTSEQNSESGEHDDAGIYQCACAQSARC